MQDAAGVGYMPSVAMVAYPLQRAIDRSWFSAMCWSDPRPHSKKSLIYGVER